jgi:hypothetical protein
VRIRGFDVPDLIGGLLIFVAGCALAIGATSYPLGQLTRMGPGYLPLVTGVILAALGLGLIASSRSSHSTLPEVRLKAMIAIFASILWWGLTIERFGLVPATFGLVLLASLAQQRPRPLVVLAAAIVISGLAVGIFIWGLGMPIYPVRYRP